VKNDKFIEDVKTHIHNTKNINIDTLSAKIEEKYRKDIIHLREIYLDMEKIINKELLINSYNYLFLLNININENKIGNLEKINTYFKYTPEQIRMMICIDLYKEISENYMLINKYGIINVVKIILNTI
jgi:hypothetical protein